MTEHDHLTARERRLFDELPRESSLPSAEADQILRALRRGGFTRRRSTAYRVALQMAAAVALVVGGAWAGARHERDRSLEGMLARADLSVGDRVLVLQRAGSAYVRAAHGYAAATTQADSNAVEVANQVLRGAASALVKSNLKSPLSTGLVNVLQSTDKARQPLLWY